eukprot:SAG22_NODE_1049_length_5844_cov_2.122520_6_plen_63_part_00
MHKCGVGLAQTMIDNIDCPAQVSLLHGGMTAEDVCGLFKDSTGASVRAVEPQGKAGTQKERQ